MDFAVWNTLHDGTVESAQGNLPGDVTLRVGIRYLCEKLPTRAEGLWLVLKGCSRFEFRAFESKSGIGSTELGACDFEILSGDVEGDVVVVTCLEGLLYLAYEGVEIRLVDGGVISQEQLEAAAAGYWEEWRLREGRA